DMDFTTRDLYRKEIQHLARGAGISEVQVAQEALSAASAAAADAGEENRARVSDPGYHLIAQGRPALEARIGYAAPWRLRLNRLVVHSGIAGYVGLTLAVTAVLAWLAFRVLWSPGNAVGWMGLFLLLAFFPLTEFVAAV